MENKNKRDYKRDNKKYIGLKKLAAAGVLFLLAFNGLFGAELATRRFGLFVGSNNGGRDRVRLRYAVNDARAISQVFTGMGGILANDNIILVEPTVGEINRQLDNLGRISSQARRNNQRTELVFYYSGHSDENGILLDRERYGYRELRERINAVQVDMRIVILDSCSSGAITRAKGGVKTQPFLFDSSVSAEGYAFLTSSSVDEASQESDSIRSSYFTHSLLAGLRGAADSVGDGRVTLNELYRFAYSETLAKTETSTFGVQHPSYDIQLSGSGDVVLTDIKDISASLVFSEDITGRISIRDSSDFLVAELTKVIRRPLALGLEPGPYRITLQRGDGFFRADINLPENQQTSIGMGNFSAIAGVSGNRSRGADSEWDDLDAEDIPFNIQLWPGLELFGNSGKNATNNILLGIFIAEGYNLRGAGAAGLGLINRGYVRGVQGSGLFNFAYGDVFGVQAAGIFNMADKNVQGLQSSGIFNYAGGEVFGIQSAGIYNRAGTVKGAQAALVNLNGGGYGAMFGLVNISDSEDIVPFGLVNVMKNGLFHPAIYIDDMLFSNISFRSGSKHFYSVLSAGVGGDLFFGSGGKLLAARAGFGFEYPVNNFFFDIDISSGSIINLDKLREKSDEPDDGGSSWGDASTTSISQIRLSAGYKIFPRLAVFAGVSYDYFYRHLDTCPDPEDFGGPVLGITNGRHTHKLGFFGGVQF